MTIVEKLLRRRKINLETGCWEWTGAKFTSGLGYGLIRVCSNDKSVNKLVHRMAYEALIGPIPAGLCVLHHCDNPPCFNPDHLFLGTHQDNIRDRDSKGRQASGLRSGRYTKPERNATGDRHGSRTKPECVPRGDRHGSHTKPERVARGSRHGSHTKPECIARGIRSGAYTKPERLPRGERNGLAKLTEEKVREIRQQAGIKTLAVLANEYGVTDVAISCVIRRKTWKHVE